MKTKVMVFEREGTRTSSRIMVNDVVFEEVDEVLYLGCIFDRNGKYIADLERRVSAEHSMNGVLRNLLGNRHVSQKTRLEIHNAIE